jgi:hypothetical protein
MKIGDYVFTKDGKDTPKPRLRRVIEVASVENSDAEHDYIVATVETIFSGDPFGMIFHEHNLRLAERTEIVSYVPVE